MTWCCPASPDAFPDAAEPPVRTPPGVSTCAVRSSTVRYRSVGLLDRFTAEELRDTVATMWTVDEVRPAKLYANDVALAGGPAPGPEVERDERGRLMFPGFLLRAHKQ